MIYLPSHVRVFLAPGSTDMRKAINSLSILVEDSLRLDPFSGHLFVFCNRGKTILKILYWDRNGFCLWQKRLEKHRFKWPQNTKETMEVGPRELSFILEGLDISTIRAYDELKYMSVI
jgi:transposase